MNTDKFKLLFKRIKELTRSLVSPINPAEASSNKEQDWLRGYRCLIHAEIESYFEAVAEELALMALNKWKTEGVSSRVLSALVSFSKRKLSSIATYWANPANHKYLHITERMQEYVNTYIGMLNANHGIKDENLLNILLPIGISFDEIDNAWLNTMNSFGEERGKVAHLTSRALDLIDPQDEIKTVVFVLKGIRKIDKKISILRKSI